MLVLTTRKICSLPILNYPFEEKSRHSYDLMFSRHFTSEMMKFLDWFLILLSLLTAREKLIALLEGEDKVVTGGFRIVGSRWLDENIKYKVII